MQNEAKFDADWEALRARAEAALKPGLAGRVQAGLASEQAAPSALRTLAVAVATSAACCLLAFSLTTWKTQRANHSALEQWVAFDDGTDNSYTDLKP